MASSTLGWLSGLRQVPASLSAVSSLIKPEDWSKGSLGTFRDVTLTFETSCLKQAVIHLGGPAQPSAPDLSSKTPGPRPHHPSGTAPDCPPSRPSPDTGLSTTLPNPCYNLQRQHPSFAGTPFTSEEASTVQRVAGNSKEDLGLEVREPWT